MLSGPGVTTADGGNLQACQATAAGVGLSSNSEFGRDLSVGITTPYFKG
jgi:hypothetical protein